MTSPRLPLLPARIAEASALVSGVLYFLAFAGFDQWWLTFVALVPLLLALEGATTRRTTWLAFLCGLSMNLGGFYWLLGMLRDFSGFPTSLCLLFVVIICSYNAGRLALLGWLYGRASNRGWPAPLVFVLAFAASELLYPLLFPWYYAATVHQVPLLVQTADLAGPIGVGLVLLAVNLAVAEPIRAKLARVPVRRPILFAGLGALLGALAYGAIRIRQTDARIAAAEPVRVGYVQGNMGLFQKHEDPGEGLRRHRELTADLRARNADFVVWSESSVTAAVLEDRAMKTGYFRDYFARSLNVPTIFGAVLVRRGERRDKWFNTALATDLRGEITGRYDKQYLLAFGEYIPFGETFPSLYDISPHSGKFSPGTSIEPIMLDVRGTQHPVSVLLCYEDILPGFTNNAVSHADPEMIVNITNDAWFGDTNEPWQHLALAKFRAVEHRRYLVRSTNSGVSALVDPNGRVVANTKTFVKDAQVAEARWMHSRTLYEMIGDAPWYLASLAIGIAAFRRRHRSTPPSPTAAHKTDETEETDKTGA